MLLTETAHSISQNYYVMFTAHVSLMFTTQNAQENTGSVTMDGIAAFLETEKVAHSKRDGGAKPGGESRGDSEMCRTKQQLYKVLKEEMVGREVTDTLVQLSANHIETMKNEMVQFVLHIVMECGGGMSGLGREKMIEDGVLDIILWSFKGDIPAHLQVVALQGLHALLGDCFSLEDVMADAEFKGFYADCLQLVDETAAAVKKVQTAAMAAAGGKKGKKSKKSKKGQNNGAVEPEVNTDKPVLVFENLTAIQRRKVHMVAKFANLEHASSGPPNARIVTVSPAQSDKEFLSRQSGEKMTRFNSVVSKSVDEEPPEEPEPETKKRKGRFRFGRKKVKAAPKAPPRIEEPGVDPWAQEFYDSNRQKLLELGVVKMLCDVIQDQTREAEVTFNALEDLFELAKHNCCSPFEQSVVFSVCAETLEHADIGVAVLAAFNLAAIVSSPVRCRPCHSQAPRCNGMSC